MLFEELREMKPLVLISNDDGFRAKGLRSLVGMLHGMADLVVIAPDCPRSAASCCVTAAVPVSAKEVLRKEGLVVYSCTGTPVDCLKLGLGQFVPHTPDLVVSGINHGTNVAFNAHYSGTVAVAKEGALHGIPSVAFSLSDFNEDADFSPMASSVRYLVRKVLEKGLPPGSLLNVNFPATASYKGFKVCRMSMGSWHGEFTRKETYAGRDYYWLGGEEVYDNPLDEESDSWALDHDYIAITPIKVNETDYLLKDTVSQWHL